MKKIIQGNSIFETHMSQISVDLCCWNRTDVKIAVAAKVGDVNGSNGIFLGVRIDKGGCETYAAGGIFLFIFPNESIFLLANDIRKLEM